MNTQVIELTTTDWTKIDFQVAEDSDWFSFRVDTDMVFSTIPNPGIEEQIPLPANIRFMYKRPHTFFIKWAIGNKIFLSPFEK